jgi:hypothetical protein
MQDRPLLPQLLVSGRVRMSANPLRLGERSVLSIMPLHPWGEQPPEDDRENWASYLRGRELLNIAICLDDIEHLCRVLEVIRDGTDYVQKLIGKYIVLEVMSAVACFRSLGRTSDELRNLASRLAKDLKALGKKHRFPEIRNRLAAHRHSDRQASINLSPEELIELWSHVSASAIDEHIGLLNVYVLSLQNLCPDEFQMIIATRNRECPGAIVENNNPDYVEFYDQSSSVAE